MTAGGGRLQEMMEENEKPFRSMFRGMIPAMRVCAAASSP